MLYRTKIDTKNRPDKGEAPLVHTLLLSIIRFEKTREIKGGHWRQELFNSSLKLRLKVAFFFSNPKFNDFINVKSDIDHSGLAEHIMGKVWIRLRHVISYLLIFTLVVLVSY